MSTSPYLRPPIVEAIIEFRFTKPIEIEAVEDMRSALADRYPRMAKLEDHEIQIAEGRAPVVMPPRTRRYRFNSLDEANICVVSTQGIVTSRLAPYLGWEAIEADALLNWKAVERILKRGTVQRIGVRYINRIDIPTPETKAINPSDYLRLLLKGPTDIMGEVNSFQASVTVKPPNDDGWLINLATGTVAPAPIVNHTSLLLDIDVWRTEGIPAGRDAVREMLAQARQLKNRTFESLVTDTSRALFR